MAKSDRRGAGGKRVGPVVPLAAAGVVGVALALVVTGAGATAGCKGGVLVVAVVFEVEVQGGGTGTVCGLDDDALPISTLLVVGMPPLSTTY